jgi:16S rRNA G1207 methylase RsmC
MTSPGRLRLLALRDQADAVGQTMEHEQERFTALKNREAVRVVAAFNLFQTPEAIADIMTRTADIEDHHRILEPSAGLGRIYRAIRYRTSAPITMVEIAPQCAAELYRETQTDSACQLIQDDFLNCDADRLGGTFDRIVMNPPFKNARDIKHIFRAFELLKPGGRIVSLCYAGPRQQAAFKNVNGWTWTDLEPGSFKSEGTGASVAMITREADA